jgi:hypothetical protein
MRDCPVPSMAAVHAAIPCLVYVDAGSKAHAGTRYVAVCMCSCHDTALCLSNPGAAVPQQHGDVVRVLLRPTLRCHCCRRACIGIWLFHRMHTILMSNLILPMRISVQCISPASAAAGRVGGKAHFDRRPAAMATYISNDLIFVYFSRVDFM